MKAKKDNFFDSYFFSEMLLKKNGVVLRGLVTLFLFLYKFVDLNTTLACVFQANIASGF